MHRLRNTILHLMALLIVSGLVLHEVIPHHHHAFTGGEYACCQSHHHDSSHHHSEKPCTLLKHIYFENSKPQIQVFALEHGDVVAHFAVAACADCFNLPVFQKNTDERAFPFLALFSSSHHQTPFSHRGPPQA